MSTVRTRTALTAAAMTLVLAGCATQPEAPTAAPATPAGMPSTESARAQALFERAFDERLALEPEYAAQLGIELRQGDWNDVTEAGHRARRDLARRQLEELRAGIDPARLDPATRLSYDLIALDLERRIESWRWRNHRYVFNPMSGLQSSLPAFLINTHRVQDEQDALDYIARLEKVGPLLAAAIEGSERAGRRGVLAPRFVFPQVASNAGNVIRGRPFDEGPADSTLLADFAGKVAALKLPQERSEALLAAANRALLDSVGPGYRAVIAWAEAAARRATTDDGAWKLPHGEGYYAFLLRQHTTTGLDAEEIHRIGLAEVARIHDEMRAIMRQVGFAGDLPAFFEHLRTDDRFYYPDTAEGRAAYLADATRVIGAMRARLPELFRTLPRADITVKAVEPFREQTAGKAFYQRPSADGSRPGIYYANTHDMREMPRFEMEALAYHEGIPGHHMQAAIAGELESLPRFRRFGGYTAYSEGWGLYSERVPKEIGFYVDPYADFGRLTLELLRAVRLVVDTGLHAKRWTREQVIRYHLDNTPVREGAAVRATERYIVNPGQATAYTIGMLKIVELRARAAEALGPRFDVRDFHEVVLSSGSVPLTVLEAEVDRWIAATRRPAS